MIGKSVYLYGKSTPLTTVADLIFDYLTNQVLAFVIDKPGWRSQARIIPWSGIQSVNASGVTAWSKNMVVLAEHLYRVKQVLERPNLTKGMPIITETGWHLGVMTDVYFSEMTGTLLGYEVKGGIFATDEGYSYVPAPATLRIHGNAAYVPSQIVRQMEERPLPGQRGLSPLERTLGRCVRHAVRAGDGSLIAAAGQIVTEAIINQARAAGKETELLRAVGITPNGKG
ncbi:MAG: PRC-barrel domain-containing protein [Chloroflexi bacterium]|nr:PRC-barrel domain-containing protein [Chloroflexota bacterium]